jgi:hypothetical protein
MSELSDDDLMNILLRGSSDEIGEVLAGLAASVIFLTLVSCSRQVCAAAIRRPHWLFSYVRRGKLYFRTA